MDSYQIKILENIHQEMVSGKLTDVTVTCKDGTTTASRLVLAAMSPYFQGMFSSDMAEARTGILDLPSVSLSVFQDILKLCLCGGNPLNEDNWMEFLDVAEMMQLAHIKQLCIVYLDKHLTLTLDNCLQWWRSLTIYSLLDIAKRAFCFLTDNMTDFLQTENLVQVTKEELFEILTSDKLTCNETDIMKAVMEWIGHNHPNQKDVQAIFEHVRMDLVDRSYLVNEVAFSDVVFTNEPVKNLVQNVLSALLPPATTTSRSTAKRCDVYILHRKGTSLLTLFTSDEKWENVTPAPLDPGSWYSAARLDDKIYITGGLNKMKSTLLYDISNKTWSVGPHLKHDHCYHCSATVNSKVYVLGGDYSSSVEEMSDSAAQWQVVGDLRQERYNTCCVTVGDNILVMGGTVVQTGVNTIQCFNARTHCVTTLNSKLLFSSSLLRCTVHLPDVYLLDNDGNVILMNISEKEGEIKMDYKLIRKWRSFGYMFGISHRDGNLLCFSNNGVSILNLASGEEEENSLPKPPRSGVVFDVL